MRLPTLAVGALAGALLSTLAACGSSSADSPAAASKPSSAVTTSEAMTAGSVSPAPAATTPMSGGAALADTGHLVLVLEAINPAIGTDERDLIAKSKALCSRVDNGESANELSADAAKSFTQGSWVPSGEEAQTIVATVKAYGGC